MLVVKPSQVKLIHIHKKRKKTGDVYTLYKFSNRELVATHARHFCQGFFSFLLLLSGWWRKQLKERKKWVIIFESFQCHNSASTTPLHRWMRNVCHEYWIAGSLNCVSCEVRRIGLYGLVLVVLPAKIVPRLTQVSLLES